MSGSVLALGPPTPYDPWKPMIEQGQANELQAKNVGQQIQNELANLGLQYKAAFQRPLFSALGVQPPATPDVTARQNGGLIGAISSAIAPTGANALAMAPPTSGNALASDPGQTTGPGGMVHPMFGVAMPYGWAGAVGADPEKSPAALKTYQDWQRQQVSQSINRADSPGAWDANVADLWRRGIITTQVAQQFAGRFDEKDYFSKALTPPEAQLTTGLEATRAGLVSGPSGYQAGGPGIPAAGLRSEAEVAGAGNVTPYTTEPVQVGTDAAGKPIYAPVNTTRTGAARQFSAAAGAPTAASLADPNHAISAGDFVNRAIGRESGGNFGTFNRSGPGGSASSNAAGGLQFIPSTFVDLVRTNRPDLAQGKTDAQIAAMRADTSPAGVALQREMGAAYAQQNAAALTSSGVPVNSLTLGLAHQFGAQGAAAVLAAPPTEKITPALVGQAAFDANRGAWAGKTVSQIMGDAYAHYGQNPVQMGGTVPAAPIVSAPGAPGVAPPSVQTAPAVVPQGAGPVQGVAGPAIIPPQQAPAVAVAQKAAETSNEATLGATTKLREQLQTEAAAAVQANTRLDSLIQHSQSWQMGKFADHVQEAKSTLDYLGQAVGFKPSQGIGDWQAFNKDAVNLLQAAVNQTNNVRAAAEWGILQRSLPTDLMSPQAFQTIASELKGLNDYKIAKSAAAAAWTGNPNAFEASWNQTISPTAFILRYMPVDAAQRMAVNLNKTPDGKNQWATLVAESHLLDQRGIYGLTAH